MQYRLYQDGEINFTLQDPENKTIAIISLDNMPPYWFSVLRDLRKKPFQRQAVYSGVDKQEELKKAYNYAKEFARQINPDFQDLTQLEELERKSSASL